ncbi:ABC transporter ATP-binding protein [Streptomyces sp. SDT5-1]|uniref:ABC transporter ATP-binding protein n=1 Tax=Streptomyces sp. SDT5-1 TaxID=3406418 RepID=UPI003FD594CE
MTHQQQVRPHPTRTAMRAADMTVSYDNREVLHQAALTLRPAQVTALVGPNGSGKSTLLRAMARLERVHVGARVSLTAADGAETDALELPPRAFAQRVALMPQSRPVPSGLDVRSVVELGRHPYRGRFGGRDVQAAQAVRRALELTGTADLAGRPADQLSGGQLQRVWLASCLAQGTDVLLLDEPTTYLDVRYQVELLDLIRELADEHLIAVGVVLHDLDQAADVADRIALLHDGRLRATGTPDEVLTSEQLSEVYGIRIETFTDPLTGRLRTRAVGRHHLRRERAHSTQ